MERYVLIDHTADMMVKAFGGTLEECFANAAYALFDQTVDLTNVGTSETAEIRVSGIDDEDRLFSFLSELLYIEDSDNLILKEFEVTFVGDDVVCAARGETLDRSKHRLRSEVKAVTYHMMDIDRETPSVTVLFDVRGRATRSDTEVPLPTPPARVSSNLASVDASRQRLKRRPVAGSAGMGQFGSAELTFRPNRNRSR